MTVTVSPDRREGVGSQRWGPARRVTLKRSPGAPLGVSIVGGKVDIISKHDSDDGQEKAIFGIFIKNVVPNSPAGKSGELQTGDRILEVDGVCVRSAQHERAVQLIKAAGNTVTLTVQSLQAWNTDSSDVDGSTPSPTKKRKAPATPAASNASATASAPANASATTNATKATNSAPAPASAPPVTGNTPESEVKITVTSDPEQEKATSESTNQQKESSEPEKPKPVYSSSESEDEGEDERHQGGRIYTEAGVEIDRASAGAVRRSREEREADPEEEDEFGYTTNKIKKKYASLGESVVVVRLERAPKWGLGLSLAGHRDRSRMAVFVCGMHPEGSASKASPPINVGDEILEVNGIVLHGRCHLNASAIIKGLMGPVFKFIFLRRKEAVEDVAVKPLTQFPAGIDEDADDRFVNYKNVRDIIIKKGQGGLGIMIIEGRHAEAGRGIFVSDLQEGSAAELAGLNIGDMLLAVNKDSLLECSYDAAAAKLKQTEGIVTLTVSTPNVKENEKAEEIKADAPAEKAEVKPAAPAKAEPPPDPSVAPVNSNQDTVIEINSNNELLGVVLLGGSDTLINGPAAIILDIYKNGAIGKDGRLQVGDQIKDCNGIAITKEMSHDRICMTVKQKAPKLKMTIHRQDPLVYDEVEVELTRKGGRPLGVTCVQPVAAQGVYLGDPLPGSPAEVDGKLQKGDILVAVDGKDMTNADLIAAATAFKLTGNKTTIKVKRFKIR